MVLRRLFRARIPWATFPDYPSLINQLLGFPRCDWLGEPHGGHSLCSSGSSIFRVSPPRIYEEEALFLCRKRRSLSETSPWMLCPFFFETCSDLRIPYFKYSAPAVRKKSHLRSIEVPFFGFCLETPHLLNLLRKTPVSRSSLLYSFFSLQRRNFYLLVYLVASSFLGDCFPPPS